MVVVAQKIYGSYINHVFHTNSIGHSASTKNPSAGKLRRLCGCERPRKRMFMHGGVEIVRIPPRLVALYGPGLSDGANCWLGRSATPPLLQMLLVILSYRL